MLCSYWGKGPLCRRTGSVDKWGIMSNSGKTVPVFVFVIAAVAVAIITLIFVAGPGSRSSSPDVTDQAPAEMVPDKGTAEVTPPAVLPSNPGVDTSAKLKQKIKILRSQIARAKVNAVNSDPTLKEKFQEIQRIHNEITDGFKKHPSMIAHNANRAATDLEYRRVGAELGKLRIHVEVHMKESDGDKKLAPRSGCEFCKADFGKTGLRAEAAETNYSKMIASFDSRQRELIAMLREHDRKRAELEVEVCEEDPHLKELVARRAEMDASLDEVLAARPELAALFMQRDEASEEFERVRRTMLAKDGVK